MLNDATAAAGAHNALEGGTEMTHTTTSRRHAEIERRVAEGRCMDCGRRLPAGRGCAQCAKCQRRDNADEARWFHDMLEQQAARR